MSAEGILARRRQFSRRKQLRRRRLLAAAVFLVEQALFGTLAAAFSGVRTTWSHLRSTDFWTVTVLQVRPR